MKQRQALREALARPGLIVAPVCINALTARVVEQLGFPVVYLGGYALGCSTCVTEPLTSMIELVEASSQIARRIDTPLVVDGDGGFGEAMHTMRAVRELIWGGVSGVHIEDQHFPKRAHYHRDYIEHTIPLDDLLAKIRMADRARREADPDFVLIARTDAIRTEGYNEGVRRANALFGAGADLVMAFPDDLDQAAKFPRDVDGPVVYVNSLGNRVGRPVLTVRELEDMGYKMVVEAMAALLLSYKVARDAYRSLRDVGSPVLPQGEAIEIRKEIEDLIGMDEFYRIEEATVERPLAGEALGG
ncbi:MAG TPA: isocitrate lyase/PEP mutase family protein [Actinomycetes bacterium]|nr:isocitrate lyase/PEP mutase family protein [Actinomycetes bacterium]